MNITISLTGYSKYLIVILLTMSGTQSILAQALPPAPQDKAVVYFVRNSWLGFIIPFDYYDGPRIIARFNGVKYFRYECDPGAHVLWAGSENRDFVKADLEAGKNYLIHAKPQQGLIMAQVKLVPLDPADPAHARRMGRLVKFMSKRESQVFSPEKLEEWNTGFYRTSGTAGMARYEKLAATGSLRIVPLSKNMYYPR